MTTGTVAKETAGRTEMAARRTGVTWEIDPGHTLVEFGVRHLMISKVKGRFAGVSGTIVEGPEPGAVRVDVTLDAATIDTREAKRDEHLKAPDFLDVEQHPEIRFSARRAEAVADGRYRLAGDLTVRGVTRELELDVTAQGRVSDPWGNERVGYSATGRINRKDFGMEWNMALEAGGILVGEEVEISIEVEAIRQSN